MTTERARQQSEAARAASGSSPPTLTGPALRDRSQGLHPLATRPREKAPVASSCQQQVNCTPEGLAADSDADPGCKISTVTGVGFIVLDLDVEDGINGIATAEALEEGSQPHLHGGLPRGHRTRKTPMPAGGTQTRAAVPSRTSVALPSSLRASPGRLAPAATP